MTILLAMILTIGATSANVPQLVSFPSADGGVVFANLYGTGKKGVVLAHGGRFNKESWDAQAQILAKAGFRVLAIDFRGYGKSTGPGSNDVLSAPLYQDVLAAVRYLRKTGVKSVSLIGGSMGGAAAADAMVGAESGEIERLIGLGSVAGEFPLSKVRGEKLFILTRDDTSGSGLRLPGFLKAYEATSEPKRMILLEGSAHAQFMFQSEHSDRVMREILDFLNAKSAVK
jgi:pimeloyl-ACP methyl ester carboxylesterase